MRRSPLYSSHHRQNSPCAFRFVALLVAVLLVAGCGLFEDDDRQYRMPPPDDDRPYTLVDLRHTTIQNPVDYRLHRDQYNYQGTYGFHRLFEHFETYDYPWIASDEKLSGPRLAPFDVLFINLVHDRRPDFTDDEIQAIKDFVYDGGGLFVIGDHTNVYRHAERINPFLEPMGIRMMYHTAVDYPPFYSVSGLGWIMSFDFADHPVNEDIEMISFKTGGPVESEDPDDDLVFTSEQSFADYWDESNERGFYGNWSQGDDEELEPSGPLSIAAATEYGDGRAVLVGDQNIFGDAWVNLGHNFEFAANIQEWLVGNENTDTPLRDKRRKGHNIAFESDVNFYQTLRNDTPGHGYYTAFIETNRNEQLTARATPGLETRNVDTLFFWSSDIEFGEPELDERTYTDDELDEIEHFLTNGGQVAISFEPTDIPEPTEKLLERLAPQFQIDYGEGVWSPGDESQPQPERALGFHTIASTDIETDDLRLGSLSPGEFPPYTPEEYQQVQDELEEESDEDEVRPDNEEIYRAIAYDYEPEQFYEGGMREDVGAYLYEVTSDWGQSFVDAQLSSGGSATIAQKKVVGDGELIIFVQDGFWRNRTLGRDELLEPKAFFRKDIVEFHHRFLDYLRGH